MVSAQRDIGRGKMSNFLEAQKVRYPDDCATIREKVFHNDPTYSNILVERLWEAYSDRMAAGWLIVDEESLTDFAEWVCQ